MTKLPKLSIVIPFFNQKDLLIEMIASICNNDFRDWELLAVNDGSTVETIDALSQYVEGDDRIRILNRNRAPKGAQTCRNIGLEQARGEFIVFFDSDDYISPRCLGRRVHAMESHKQMDFLVFPSGTYEHGTLCQTDVVNVYGYPIFKDDLQGFASRILPFIVWSNIYRTSALREHSISWDTNLLALQDADFNLQCLLAGMQYDYVQTEPDYAYRIVGNNRSVSKNIFSQTRWESHLYALEKFYQLLQQRADGKYHHDLYRGVLYIYNIIFSNHVYLKPALRLARMMEQYSRGYAILLRLQVRLSNLLGYVFPGRIARALPMAGYLLWRMFEQRRIIRERMKFIHSSSNQSYK